MTKIKPCPLCGATMEWRDNIVIHKDVKNPQCIIYMLELNDDGKYYGEKDEVISQWNRRV